MKEQPFSFSFAFLAFAVADTIHISQLSLVRYGIPNLRVLFQQRERARMRDRDRETGEGIYKKKNPIKKHVFITVDCGRAVRYVTPHFLGLSYFFAFVEKFASSFEVQNHFLAISGKFGKNRRGPLSHTLTYQLSLLSYVS